MEKGKDPFWYRGLISLLIMGLFMEWLHPLRSLNIMSFGEEWFPAMYLFTGMLLLLGLFGLKWKIYMPLYGLCTLGVWAYMVRGSEETAGFMSSLILLLRDAGMILSNGQFSMISQESRMLVLMIGWALLVYSVQSLALLRSSVLLFAMATLIYLFCLETLLDISVYGDIVRTGALILMLQGMIHLSRLRESGKIDHVFRQAYSRWSFLLTAAVLLLAAVSWLGVTLAQPGPAARISLQQTAERLAEWVKAEYGKEAVAVTGYNLSGEEEEMGLPLRQSNRVYFTAQTPVATYWRGETFSEYNGRKWSETEDDVKTGYAPGIIANPSDYTTGKPQTITQRVEFAQPPRQSFPLFGGGKAAEIADLQLLPGTRALPASIEYNVDAGTVKVILDKGQPQVEGYTLKVEIPGKDPQGLRKETGADPMPVRKRYLQLPEKLPQRVKDLAAELVKGASSRYEQVEAVNNYLRQHGSYTLDTRVPPEGQDFVDDFLFVTHEGYCNHYSTAMAVLLRSQGIPTRYVKGFTQGKQDSVHPDLYSVSEGDAHSWVEVYFPESGWVPFDPTPGFAIFGGTDRPASAFYHLSAAGSDALSKMTEYAAAGWLRTVDFIWRKKVLMIEIAVIAAILGIAAVILKPWLGRVPLWLRLHTTRRRFPGREELMREALGVWHALARRFGAPQAGCTAREYIGNLPVEQEELRALLYDFTADWEMIAYDEGPMNRSRCIAFLRRCLRISKKVA